MVQKKKNTTSCFATKSPYLDFESTPQIGSLNTECGIKGDKKV